MLILAASLAICNDRLRQETGDTPDYCLVVLLITKNTPEFYYREISRCCPAQPLYQLQSVFCRAFFSVELSTPGSPGDISPSQVVSDMRWEAVILPAANIIVIFL